MIYTIELSETALEHLKLFKKSGQKKLLIKFLKLKY